MGFLILLLDIFSPESDIWYLLTSDLVLPHHLHSSTLAYILMAVTLAPGQLTLNRLNPSLRFIRMTSHRRQHRPSQFKSIRTISHRRQHRLSRCPSTPRLYQRRLINHLYSSHPTTFPSATNSFHPTSTGYTSTMMGWTGGYKMSSQKITGP